MAELTCIVVTPETTALEETTSFVALPLYDGEMGVAVNHAPMIGRLGFGELRLRRGDGETVQYYIDGGFVQIANNVVSVLTNQAIPAAELDEAEAREQLTAATGMKANSVELLASRERAVDQARAQIRVARRHQ